MFNFLFFLKKKKKFRVIEFTEKNYNYNEFYSCIF